MAVPLAMSDVNYSLNGPMIRGRCAGKGSTQVEGEGSRRLMKIVPAFGPVATQKPQGLDVFWRDSKSPGTDRAALGPRSKEAREYAPRRLTPTVTADLRMMGKQSLGHYANISSLPSSDLCNYNERISKLISIFEGASPTATVLRKPASMGIRIQSHPVAYSYSTRVERADHLAAAATQTQVLRQNEARKVSIPPAFIEQRPLSSSPNIIPPKPGVGANSLASLDKHFGPSNSDLPREEQSFYRTHATRDAHVHSVKPKRALVDSLWSVYERQRGASTAMSKKNENDVSNFRNIRTCGREHGVINQERIPTAPRQRKLVIKSLNDCNDHRQATTTNMKDKNELSITYNSARAVFAGDCVRSKGADEGNEHPDKCILCCPGVATKGSRLEESRIFEAKKKIASSQRTLNTRTDHRQIPQWAYHSSSPKIVNKTWLNQTEARGKILLSHNLLTPTVDAKPSPECTPRYYSPKEPTTRWRNRCVSPEASGEIILPTRTPKPTATFEKSLQSADACSGSCGLAIMGSSASTRPENFISNSNIPRRPSYPCPLTVPTRPEISRANDRNPTSPSRESPGIRRERPSHREHIVGYPCVADISRINGDICLSSPCPPPMTQTPYRKNGERMENASVMLTEDIGSCSRRQWSAGSEGIHGYLKSQSREEVIVRMAKGKRTNGRSSRKETAAETYAQQYPEGVGQEKSTQSKNASTFNDAADSCIDSTAHAQASNLIGWVSRVVNYFEKITTSEQSSGREVNRSESRNSAPGDMERESRDKRGKKILGPSLFSRRKKSVSCPGVGKSRLELEPKRSATLPRKASRRRVDSRPDVLHGLSSNSSEDIPRRGKILRKCQRSISLITYENRRNGDETRHRGIGSVTLTRCASSVSSPSCHRAAMDFGSHSDERVDTLNDRVARTDSSSTRVSWNPGEDMHADWEYEENYLRKKLHSYSSEDGQDTSVPSSPENDYKVFRRAVYGSIFATEGAYIYPYIPLHMEGAESEGNDGLSPSPSLGCNVNAAASHESESVKSNSSDENLDYDSGVVDDSEDSSQKTLEPRQPCLRFTDIIENNESMTLWSHIPEIANSDFVRTLSSNQIKLQEAKFEVITTETTYMMCLCILISHFYGSEIFNNEKVLSKEDRESLFSNIVEVRNCSQRLLSDLKWCWQDDISLQDLDEIILKHAEETFGAYVTYCFNQVHQLNVLNKLIVLEQFFRFYGEISTAPSKSDAPRRRFCTRSLFRTKENVAVLFHQSCLSLLEYVMVLSVAELRYDCKKSEVFLKAIDELESHPVCRRKTLQCYLIMPMQRVTRIRLLVDVVLARLSRDNQKYHGWKLASDALNRVVQQCNDAARHAALQEETKSLCRKLDFRGFKHLDMDLDEHLLIHRGDVFHIYSSSARPSNHLGALSNRKIMKQPFNFGRKLIKQPLHLFLFMDVLLVTKKKSDGIFAVLVYCPRSDVEIFNGDPYSLQELPQKNFPEQWKNVFHLFMHKSCEKDMIEMILSAPNEYEKELWLDSFSTAFQPADALYAPNAER